MDMLTISQKLEAKRKWWEAVAERVAESAAADWNCNLTLSLAQQKITAIKRNEKHNAIGAFKRCELCNNIIDDDRLEAILDSEWHYCAECASKPAAAHVPQKSTGRSNGYRNYSRSALRMVYSY